MLMQDREIALSYFKAVKEFKRVFKKFEMENELKELDEMHFAFMEKLEKKLKDKADHEQKEHYQKMVELFI